MVLGKSLGIAVFLSLICAWPQAAAAGSKEYKVKAAYLYNFVKFIDWPDSAFGDASAPVTICVLGEDRFEGILEKAVAGKEVRGHGVVVRSLGAGAPTPASAECQILFVSPSEQGRVAEILADVAEAPVVTVGEMAGFAESGGILNFTIDGGRVKVELNMEAANRAGLRVSGKLQQVTKAVGG